jgi:hypothetical protein
MRVYSLAAVGNPLMPKAVTALGAAHHRRHYYFLLSTIPLQDYYELGVILTRKKLFTQATKNLEKAKKTWDGEEADLAQVGGSW